MKSPVSNLVRVTRWTLAFLESNLIPLAFLVLCTTGALYSNLSFGYLLNELVMRLSRNLLLVLALVVPVIAGLGLNFAIVLGAMAGQVGLIAVVNYKICGMRGILVATLIAVPIALAAGILAGRIFNKARGKEMITGIVLGFVANGVYQFVFLFLAGSSLIPFGNREMIRPVEPPVGLRNTVDLTPVKSALDNILKVSAKPAVSATEDADSTRPEPLEVSVRMDYVKAELGSIGCGAGLGYIEVPVGAFLLIGLFCLCILFIGRTKLGQDFRVIGQDSQIAEVAGIKVNRTRIVAVCISIVLAALGQIVCLQELGTINTYNSHEQVGMYAVAALVIGGGTVRRAGVRHAILGVLLFHMLLVVSQPALIALFGWPLIAEYFPLLRHQIPQIAEYFRVFVVYGIVAVSLVVHAWQGKRKRE